MKIAITGADGQLGSYLVQNIKDAIPITRNELDLAKVGEVYGFIRDLKPDVLINCAAYTDVNKAESESIKCFNINAASVTEMSRAAKYSNCKMIQISTDYVFGGHYTRPYTEDDYALPRGRYGSSKKVAENFCSLDDHIIIRTCGLYREGYSNFVSKMIELRDRNEIKVVDDQICAPTYINDLLEPIKYCIDNVESGLFHITNSGQCSWFNFATSIMYLISSDCKVVPISTDEWLKDNKAAPRPKFSVLDCSKFEKLFGIKMRAWEDALEDCLSKNSIIT